MAYNGITVCAVADEIRRRAVGGRVVKIQQPERDELQITIKKEKDTVKLLLSADAGLPRTYITEKTKPAPMTAPAFTMLLRKHIGSGRLVSVEQPEFERVLVFTFQHLDEMGDESEKKLVVEMMGRYSNLIFLDKDGKILDSARRVTPDISSLRTVLPGMPYEAPPSQGRRNPLEADRDSFLEALEGQTGQVAKVIPNLYTGFSRTTGEEIAYRSGVSGDTQVESLSEEEKKRIADCFSELILSIRDQRFSPCIVTEAGVPREFSAFLLTSYSAEERQEMDSISETLERFYEMRSRTALIRQRSQDLRQVLKTAVERTARKLDLQQEQFRDTEDRDTYKVYGELLNTYGYGLQPGAEELTCVNYYDGKEITIPLDPTLTAGENSKRYFDKYNKKKRTYQALLEQLETTRADLAYLQSVSHALTIAENESDLAELRKELMESGYIRTTGSGKGKRKEPASRPLHFVTEDGYHIYVGKNNLQNEELTFSFASGNDMWFHAKQRPGSHVIVKREGRDELPDHIYEIAAGLAAYYSSGKDASKVEVDYTERKNLHKSPGQPKGFVIYHTNYSMTVAPDRTGVQEVSG